MGNNDCWLFRLLCIYITMLSSADIGSSCTLWLGSNAMRCLLGLAALCFSKLYSKDTDDCIATLLSTFVQNSPHFDWVVARLGGCFPLKVISKYTDQTSWGHFLVKFLFQNFAMWSPWLCRQCEQYIGLWGRDIGLPVVCLWKWSEICPQRNVTSKFDDLWCLIVKVFEFFIHILITQRWPIHWFCANYGFVHKWRHVLSD